MATDSDSTHDFRCVADALGLGRLSDYVPGLEPAVLCDLYRHARDEDGKRVLFEKDPSFARGWVNLAAPRAQELISTFVALDDADTLKRARESAQANLEAVSWNDILGLETPAIICQIKIHGNRWGLRFRSGEPALRGREVINEDLPPIPGDHARADTATGIPVGTEPTPTSEHNATSPQTESTTNAADALRRAGLPS